MLKNQILILCLLLPILLFSQRAEVGIFIGGTNYFGDLADAIYVTKETNFSFGGEFRYNFTPKHTLKLNAYSGKITAKDANSKDPYLAPRGFTFESPITEAAAHYEFNITGKKLYNNIGEFKPFFTPFLSIGVGYTLVPGTPVAPEDRIPDPFPEAGDVSTFLIFPFGGGAKYYPFPNLVLGLEIGFRPTLNDYLDGVSVTGNPKANDWYIKGGFTIAYLFNKGPDFMNNDKNF